MFPFIQVAIDTAQTPEVSLTAAVAGIVSLGKVWDKVQGHHRDRELRNARAEMGRRLDEHAASDLLSFGRIDTSLAVLETGMGTITKQLVTIDERMYQQKGTK